MELMYSQIRFPSEFIAEDLSTTINVSTTTDVSTSTNVSSTIDVDLHVVPGGIDKNIIISKV